MRRFLEKKIWVITFLMIALGLVGVGVFFGLFKNNINIARAGSGDNVSGYAWTSNLGWISFNCTNDTPPCGASDYGVAIDSATGNFSGYAWGSEGIGWIDFAPGADLVTYPGCGYPETPCAIANYDNGTGEVTGWAQIVSLGNDGWIKLGGGSSAYGVSVNSSTGDASGWAWNGGTNGIGWISFNCADAGAGGCVNTDYKVVANVNVAPTAINLTAPNWSFSNACQFGALRAFLNWEFSDSDPGSSQSAYQVIFDDDNNPANPILDTGKVVGPAGQYNVDPSLLSYNTNYYWWVKVWDDQDAGSGSIASPMFTTYKHAFPNVNFSWLPNKPSQGENTQFTDSSTAGGGAAITGWSWIFSNGVPLTSTVQNPVVAFGASGNQSVILTATDSDGYYCDKTQTVNANVSLPGWREIKSE